MRRMNRCIQTMIVLNLSEKSIHLPSYQGSLNGLFLFSIKKEKRDRMAQVGIVMGSISDWETMKHACGVLDKLEVSYEKQVISAHRTPEDMLQFATDARGLGMKVIIAGAGGAAH